MDPLTGSPPTVPATLTLTREDVKTLSSDTRVEILKKLGDRRHTVTELAAALELSKATVLEHLEKLTAAGFIRRHEDDKRVWVYYDLADKGRRIVFQSSTRFVLLLSSAGVAALGGGAAFAAWALHSLGDVASESGTGGAAEGDQAPMPPASPSEPAQGEPSAPKDASDGLFTQEGAGPTSGAWRVLLGFALVVGASLIAWYALHSRREALDELATL